MPIFTALVFNNLCIIVDSLDRWILITLHFFDLCWYFGPDLISLYLHITDVVITRSLEIEV
jgi:hypothetical protein